MKESEHIFCLHYEGTSQFCTFLCSSVLREGKHFFSFICNANNNPHCNCSKKIKFSCVISIRGTFTATLFFHTNLRWKCWMFRNKFKFLVHFKYRGHYLGVKQTHITSNLCCIRESWTLRKQQTIYVWGYICVSPKKWTAQSLTFSKAMSIKLPINQCCYI